MQFFKEGIWASFFSSHSPEQLCSVPWGFGGGHAEQMTDCRPYTLTVCLRAGHGPAASPARVPVHLSSPGDEDRLRKWLSQNSNPGGPSPSIPLSNWPFLPPARLPQYLLLCESFVETVGGRQGKSRRLSSSRGWAQPVSATPTRDWESRHHPEGLENQLRPGDATSAGPAEGVRWKQMGFSPHPSFLIFYLIKWKESRWYLIFCNKPCCVVYPAKTIHLHPCTVRENTAKSS